MNVISIDPHLLPQEILNETTTTTTGKHFNIITIIIIINHRRHHHRHHHHLLELIPIGPPSFSEACNPLRWGRDLHDGRSVRDVLPITWNGFLRWLREAGLRLGFLLGTANQRSIKMLSDGMMMMMMKMTTTTMLMMITFWSVKHLWLCEWSSVNGLWKVIWLIVIIIFILTNFFCFMMGWWWRRRWWWWWLHFA